MNDALAEALKGEFAEQVAEILFQKIQKHGVPHKLLLTAGEAATSLGFTEAAFHQSAWSKTIPVVKVGIKNMYRLKDLETFAANNLITRLPRR